MIPAQLIAVYNDNPPSLTSVTPSSGAAAGGTALTLTGTGFLTAKSLTFGGNAVGSFTIVSDSSITFLAPAHAAGAVAPAVSLTTDSGGTVGLSYTYIAAPTVTSIAPTGGTTAGGTNVTITGTAFTGATLVQIGGVTCTSVVVVNSTTITCTTGAHAAGAVSASVTTPGGLGTGGTFTYAAPVTPGSSTFDSGSGNFIVPAYNTLTIEVWGGGANGGHAATSLAGAASTVSTYGLTANGGGKSPIGVTGGAGGTASGGNSANTTGTAGNGSSGTSSVSCCSGAGGAGAGGGGAGGAAVNGIAGVTAIEGNAGTGPGGGGSGRVTWAGTIYTKAGGGGGGGYVRHILTPGGGGPGIGAAIAYAVAAGRPIITALNGGGAGAHGRVRFTWT